MAHLPRIGETFDRYRIDSQVGFGGMGVVFGATDLRLGRPVALKVIAAQHAADDAFRRRFEREAEIMTRLDSPHVLTIYDHGVHDQTPWLSTPLVGGGDLGSLLRDQGPLPLAGAATVAAQVADALGDAHRAGVVHRDVKPSNVLLRAGTQAPHAYLCDFGIAHSSGPGLTATGGVAGSWAYIAPERTTGDHGSPASDIYSLGCLFWACLTGRPPYSGVEVEMALAHVRAPIPQLVGTDGTTARINSVLRHALAKDPEHRYASAGDFHEDLLALSRIDAPDFVAQVPEPLERGSTSTGTTLRRTGRRTSSRAAREGQGPPRRRRRLVLAATAAVLVAGAAVVVVELADGTGDGTAQGDRASRAVTGDVDGDGRGDVVFRWYDYGDDLLPSRDFVVRSTGKGYDAPQERPRPEGLGAIGDVDGDGRDDRVGMDQASGSEQVVVQTILADGEDGKGRVDGADGVDREVTWDPAPTGEGTRKGADRRGGNNRADGVPALADVDGDGLDDLVIASDLEAHTDDDVGHGARIEVALSTPEGFEEPTTWFTDPDWDLYSATVSPGDVDGDGTDELVVRDTADLPKGRKTPKTTRLTVLRAGDSGFDVAGRPHDLRQDVGLSASIDLGDVDGDDHDEVVAYVPGKSRAQVLVMEVEDGEIQTGTPWLKRDSNGYADLPTDRFLTDADGDGQTDLVWMSAPGKRSFTVDVALAGDHEFSQPETWTQIDCRNDPCDENWMILRSGT